MTSPHDFSSTCTRDHEHDAECQSPEALDPDPTANPDPIGEPIDEDEETPRD